MSESPGQPDFRMAQYAAAREMIAAAPKPAAVARQRPTPRRSSPAGIGNPPSVSRRELSAQAVVSALSLQGCLIVRGLLDYTVANDLRDGIDRAFDAYDEWSRDPEKIAGRPWFEALLPQERAVQMLRPILRSGGALFTADSPVLFSRWLEVIRATGLYRLVCDCFGERPITSLTKGTLRRVRAGEGVEWHQDGAFLGVESGAINVWVSLSDTERSPGLDIVSRRLTEVVPTGTAGAKYDWSVGQGVVDELGFPVVRPRFAPGDALIFDGLLLHRTAQELPALPETRYAIETWFFRPSSFPAHQQGPLAL